MLLVAMFSREETIATLEKKVKLHMYVVLVTLYAVDLYQEMVSVLFGQLKFAETKEQPKSFFYEGVKLTEEERLTSEIYERGKRLYDLESQRSLPVRRLILKEAHWTRRPYDRRAIRWFVAIVTLALVTIALLWTDPWSRGLKHYIRDGVMWTVVIYYFFFGATSLLYPIIDGLIAFKDSPEKIKELPDLFWYLLPTLIGIGFAGVMVYCYVNNIT